jgi:hypothetical protein
MKPFSVATARALLAAALLSVPVPGQALTLGLEVGDPVFFAGETIVDHYGDGLNRDPSDPDHEGNLIVYGNGAIRPDRFQEIDISVVYRTNSPGELSGGLPYHFLSFYDQGFDEVGALSGRLRGIGSTANTVELWFDRARGEYAAATGRQFLVEVLFPSATGPDALAWLNRNTNDSNGYLFSTDDATFTISGVIAPVPLPATLATLSGALGLLAFAARRRRRGQQRA